MEQKTEASQAVDEPVLPHLPRAVGYRHTMDNTEGIKGNKPVVVFCGTKPNPFGIPGLDYSASFPVTTETLFTADQMKAYARAALKAQPAPTEAAQGDAIKARVKELQKQGLPLHDDVVLQQLSGNSGELHPSGNTGELAQGWDVDDLISDMDINEEVAGMRAELQASSTIIPSILAAQGEDSARLDDLATIRDLDRLGMELGAKLAQMVGHLDNGVEYLPRDAIMIAVTDWRSAWSKNAKARKPINRARASAETGGVKP